MANGYTCDIAVRPLEKKLLDFTQRNGYDVEKVLTGLLDYIICFLDPTGQPADYWPFKTKDNEAFQDMMVCLFDILGTQIEKHGWYDAFGDLFMATHPRGNSKGQFFTPQCLCDLTAHCLLSHQEPVQMPRTPFGRRLTFSDPTAGSSRMLLAAAHQQTRVMVEEWGYDETTAYARRPYLVAEDIDFNCCKMSAINIALHGYFGEVVCHDTLCEPDQVRVGYIINETMWPFPTDVPSIRKANNPMSFISTRVWAAKKRENTEKVQPDKVAMLETPYTPPMQTANQQLSLF